LYRQEAEGDFLRGRDERPKAGWREVLAGEEVGRRRKGGRTLVSVLGVGLGLLGARLPFFLDSGLEAVCDM
jgi:hypothetical protein